MYEPLRRHLAVCHLAIVQRLTLARLWQPMPELPQDDQGWRPPWWSPGRKPTRATDPATRPAPIAMIASTTL
jgi:hypothetical protein